MLDPFRTFLALLLAFSLVSSLTRAQPPENGLRIAPERAAVAPPPGLPLPPPAKSARDIRAARPVARARILLAVGVGLVVGALLGTALTAGKHKCYGRPKERYEGPLYIGAGVATIGVGLSVGGLVGLLRASREARRSKQSRFLPLFGFGGLAAAFGATVFGALPEAVDCWSS